MDIFYAGAQSVCVCVCVGSSTATAGARAAQRKRRTVSSGSMSNLRFFPDNVLIRICMLLSDDFLLLVMSFEECFKNLI